MATMLDWKQLRKEIPAAERFTFLNSAGRGPVCKAAAGAGAGYYQHALIDGNIPWDEWLQRVEEIRMAAAGLIDASPRNIAFLPTSSCGMNFASAFLEQPSEDTPSEIVMSADEFPSCSLPWIQQGYTLNLVQSGEYGILPIQHLLKAVNEKTQAIVSSHVQYSTGYRQDIEALGTECNQRNLAFVVDATQSAGIVPIDVKRSKIDFAVFTAYKWLTAGCGIAVFYVADKFLDSTRFPAVGWRSSQLPYKMINDSLEIREAASALELGHPQFPNLLALGGALDFIRDIGVENITARIEQLTDYFHQRLKELNIKLLSPSDANQRAGITVIAAKDAKRIVEELRKENVIVAARGAGIRISISYYNNLEDIERFILKYLEILGHK